VNRFEFLDAGVSFGETTGELVEPCLRLTSLFIDFLQGFAGTGQPRRLKLHLGQHRAERSPLLARRRDEGLEFFSLITSGLPGLLECLEHWSLLAQATIRFPAVAERRQEQLVGVHSEYRTMSQRPAG